MNITQFYTGKTLLITGCTGFVGKVVLEKIMRSLPYVAKIFILIRPKPGMLPAQRAQKDIFDSQCFDILRKDPNFEQLSKAKVFPIEGDICKDRLGMSQQIRNQLVNEVQVLINVAASIDFNEPIADAIQINYFGLLRMLDLAKECRKLEAFTHVSTAYVNCDKRGVIDEKIYDIDIDPEQLIDNIVKMTPQQQKDNIDQILGGFPNTYTLTKAMAEKTLKKIKPYELPVCIVRPSIIASAEKEPHVGWTDTLSAAGGFSLLIIAGIARYLQSDFETRTDIIPVDYVSNTIIVSTAMIANKPGLTIVQSGSSASNPISWGPYLNILFDYAKKQPLSFQQAPPLLSYIPEKEQFQKKFYYSNELPVIAIDKITKVVPGLRSPKVSNLVSEMQKLNVKIKDIVNMFGHFTRHGWIYKNDKIYEFLDRMTPEEKAIFYMDPKEYEWPHYLHSFAYGLEHFINKQDIYDISRDTSYPLLNKMKYRRFDTERRVLLDNVLMIQDIEHVKTKVTESLDKNDRSEALKFLQKNLNSVSSPSLKSNMLIAMRYSEKVFSQIIFNKDLLNQLKDQKELGIVFALPKVQSEIDIWLLRLISQECGLHLPIVLIDQKFESPIQKLAFENAIRQLVDSKCIIATSIESQAFKVIQEHSTSSFIVPVTYNYDRIVHPSQSKMLEMIGQILRTKQNYGKVLIKFGVPITTQKSQNIRKYVEEQQQANQVIMTTSMVATALLMHRRGINFDTLLLRVTMIYNELVARNIKVAATLKPTQKMIKEALSVINDLLTQSKGGIYEPKSTSMQDLAVYSGQLASKLMNESLVATTILGLSLSSTNFTLQVLKAKAQLIQSLFDNSQQSEKIQITRVLNQMAKQGMIKFDTNNQNIQIESDNDQQCLKLSLLQNLVLPRVETILASVAWLSVSQNRSQLHDEEQLCQQIQWLVDIYLQEGLLKFREATSLKYIQAVIDQFVLMGALLREQVKLRRNNFKTFIKVAEKYPINEVLEGVLFYLPYCAHADMEYFENSIRHLTLSVLERPKL